MDRITFSEDGITDKLEKEVSVCMVRNIKGAQVPSFLHHCTVYTNCNNNLQCGDAWADLGFQKGGGC